MNLQHNSISIHIYIIYRKIFWFCYINWNPNIDLASFQQPLIDFKRNLSKYCFVLDSKHDILKSLKFFVFRNGKILFLLKSLQSNRVLVKSRVTAKTICANFQRHTVIEKIRNKQLFYVVLLDQLVPLNNTDIIFISSW